MGKRAARRRGDTYMHVRDNPPNRQPSDSARAIWGRTYILASEQGSEPFFVQPAVGALMGMHTTPATFGVMCVCSWFHLGPAAAADAKPIKKKFTKKQLRASAEKKNAKPGTQKQYQTRAFRVLLSLSLAGISLFGRGCRRHPRCRAACLGLFLSIRPRGLLLFLRLHTTTGRSRPLLALFSFRRSAFPLPGRSSFKLRLVALSLSLAAGKLSAETEAGTKR